MCVPLVSFTNSSWCWCLQVVQNVIAHATGEQPPRPPPDPQPAAHSEAYLHEKAHIVDNLARLHLADAPFENEAPGSMEENGLAYGAIEYWCGYLLDCRLLRRGASACSCIPVCMTRSPQPYMC